MAREDRLEWGSLGEVASAAKRFLDPVLAGGLDAAWSRDGWSWVRP
jgi:hypothetical protein